MANVFLLAPSRGVDDIIIIISVRTIISRLQGSAGKTASTLDVKNTSSNVLKPKES